MIFQDETVLITGGTGSLGRNLVRKIMTGALGRPQKVIILSRDEDKQHQMRLEWRGLAAATDDIAYRDADNILDFRIGDIRDYETMAGAVQEAHVVVHAAALKQVPACEYFPYESVKTNVLGVQNIIRAAGENGGKCHTVLAVSTDKACKPINAYGMCKAIQEKLVVEANLRHRKTRFICTRYGNVAGSRGSVIPLFKEQMRNAEPLTITRPDMTRFLLSKDAAARVIFDAIRAAEAGDIYVPQLWSARVIDLVEVMVGDRNVKTERLGMRPGEKVHEILVTEEEIARTIVRGDYYVVRPTLPELRRNGDEKPALTGELSSADWTMSKGELQAFLKKEGLLDL